ERIAPVARGAVAVCALAGAICVWFWGYSTPAGPRHVGTGVDMAQHPVQAAEFIEHIDLRSNIFNQHEFGSYLAWRWDGDRKLYYHGFVDDLTFYARDYLAVSESRDEFDRIVNQYNIGAFMLDRLRAPIQRAALIYQILLTTPSWRLVYYDDQSML